MRSDDAPGSILKSTTATVTLFLSLMLGMGIAERAATAETAETAATAETAIIFDVSIDPSVRDEPYSGRLYVAFAPRMDEANPGRRRGRGGPREPRLAMHAWFDPPPVFALDVVDLAPGETVAIGAGALAHPMSLADLPAGAWSVQAVARVNPDSPKAGSGSGDLCSAVTPVDVETADDDGGRAAAERRVRLVIDRVVAEEPFSETQRVRLFEMDSPALTEHLGRPRTVRAGIVLPDGYDEAREAGAEFPVVVWIGGFGGTHREALGLARRGGMQPEGAPPTIWIVPDASCYHGHAVFADSPTNGPWGTMLVDEMLPAIDAAFGGAGPEHRYVTGISSGGWASLWLQVAYPEAFAGCWSHVPDPVDFRDFQMIDLYRPGTNMYVDETGQERPLARRGDAVMLRYREFVARETVLGPGGQIHSFEAVFSPRRPDGTPRPLFDRGTGAIDTKTAEAWRPYDIAHVLRTRWDDLGPRLVGKLHVYGGGVDSFYLEGAVRLLAEELEDRDADAVVTVIEGMSHTVHAPGMADMFETIAARWEGATEAAAAAGTAGTAGALPGTSFP